MKEDTSKGLRRLKIYEIGVEILGKGENHDKKI